MLEVLLMTNCKSVLRVVLKDKKTHKIYNVLFSKEEGTDSNNKKSLSVRFLPVLGM
jgi:hypothetical protein